MKMTETSRTTVSFAGDLASAMDESVRSEQKKSVLKRRFKNRSELARYAIQQFLTREKMIRENPNLRADCAVCGQNIRIANAEDSPFGLVCKVCGKAINTDEEEVPA